MATQSVKIAFIGAGRMASAMVGGLLSKGYFRPSEIGCTCGDDPTGPALAEKTGIRYEPGLSTLLADAETIVLACKPQQFTALDPALDDAVTGKLVISILAGMPLARLRGRFSGARNLVRAMPNTPGQIGAGITAYAAASELDRPDAGTVGRVLGALGEVVALEEAQIDAVTAISGSGPAYLYEFTAALRAAGGAVGLAPDVAHKLAVATITGAARLLAASREDPEALRNAVTSPGGTTEAALNAMQAEDLRGLVERAALAAKARSIELAES